MSLPLSRGEVFAGVEARPAERALPLELATVHALAWLCLASAAGLLLALLLLAPGLAAWIAPLSYGRLMPLHLNLVLYGWLGLPLVALLLAVFLPEDGTPGAAGAARSNAAAVQAWSASLAVGAATWLAGQVTPKPFLDWRGGARVAFLAALGLLALALAHAVVARARGGTPKRTLLGLAALWLGLLSVPVAMAVATSPATWPPINPETGGPTGASLLGSTLAVIAIFAATPVLLGVAEKPAGGGQGSRRSRRAAALEVSAAFAAHSLFFAAVAHGDHSHREPRQIAAVATLLVWAWLLPRWLGRFDWPPASRKWLAAFLAWGGLLLASAVPMFLPGLLDRIKFTNALVAHSHLAMAGMATSFSGLLLGVVNRRTRLAEALDGRLPFALWQGGTAVHVLALTAAGTLEAVRPGILFGADPAITALYALRAVAGAAMLGAALAWTARAAGRMR